MFGKQFNLDVEGVGSFTFRERTFRDQVRIEALASEVLGRTPTSLRADEIVLGQVAMAYAMVATLGMEYPIGFHPDELDPLSSGDADKLMLVYRGLVDQLARFRAERHAGGAAKRP